MTCYPVKSLKTEVAPSQALLDSIIKHGLVEPIVVNCDGTILDGRARVACFKILGRDTIAGFEIYLSPTQAEEYKLTKSQRRIEIDPEEYRRVLSKVCGNMTLVEAATKLDSGVADILRMCTERR